MTNILRYRGLVAVVAGLVFGLVAVSCDGQGRGIDVRPFKFAYLADIHVDAGTLSVEDLESSVTDINSQKDIDFAIFAGDITEFGSDEEIMKAKEVMDKLVVPYYIIAGNHDSKWSESGCNTFAKVFGYEVFEFEFNGVKFIGTNSGPNMRMMPALVPRETMVWLDSVTMATPKNMPVISVNHYPLDNAMLNYQELLDYLRRTNIQLAMCGHGHNNNALDFSGVRGAMGRSNLRSGKRAEGFAGYNVVSVAGDSLWMTERKGGVTAAKPWFAIKLLKRANNPSVYENTLTGKNDSANKNGSADKKFNANKDTWAYQNTIKESDKEQPLSVVWEFQDNADIGSAPAMEFGLVYISNSAGAVKALDATNGAVIWTYTTGGKIFSSPAVHKVSATLVVGSSDNNIYGLDARTGELRWKVAANKSVLGSPTIFNDIVYIGASDGVFRALEVVTGQFVWSYDKIAGFIESKPWVDAQGVYVGDWANRVYAFDPVTGELQWEWSNNKGRGLSAAAVWPVKANGKIFVVTPERKIHALDAATGREIWAARGGREAIGLSDDANAFGTSAEHSQPSAVYIKTMQDTVIAFSTASYNSANLSPSNSSTILGSSITPGNSGSAIKVGKVGEPIKLWQSHTGYGYEIAPSPITAAYGLVFIPTDKGNIFALNATDGTVAWQYNFSIALINYILPIGSHQLLVTSMDGKVALLEL